MSMVVFILYAFSSRTRLIYIIAIEISIPPLTNSFFEKYYVKGEYARIVCDTIIWKGRKFKRK